MLSCWKENPADRPTFAGISAFFDRHQREELVSAVQSERVHFYSRQATRSIPEDYVRSCGYVTDAYLDDEKREIVDTENGYFIPLASDAIASDAIASDAIASDDMCGAVVAASGTRHCTLSSYCYSEKNELLFL